MWRSALSGVAFIALFASVSAQAADLPAAARTAPPSMIAPTPVYQWDGFYVGLNGGYGWGRSSHASTVSAGGTGDFDTSGGLFGVTVGYNYTAGSFVIGGEADLDATWVDGNATFTGGPIATFGSPGTATSQLRWLDTFRARVGYNYGQLLPYITGGAAYGNVRAIVTSPSGGAFAAGDDTRFGWTIGFGLEYMFAPSWSAKLEYNYVDLDTQTLLNVDNVSYRAHILKAGINWHIPPH
jgi:outer membrane immunogenic protein